MGRPRKKPLYAVVHAEILGCIGEDRVLDFDSDPEKPLLDELQCPLVDEVLIALRRSFSVTFPRNPFVEGLREAMMEIRRLGIEALTEIPEVLQELNLSPIPVPMQHRSHGKAYVFQYSLVRLSDLRVSVRYEGKKRSLLTLAEPVPADGLIQTLREAVSLTFAEMHDEDQYGAVLTDIRQMIWAALPPFNDHLRSIEVEPIAPDTPSSDDGGRASNGD